MVHDQSRGDRAAAAISRTVTAAASRSANSRIAASRMTAALSGHTIGCTYI